MVPSNELSILVISKVEPYSVPFLDDLATLARTLTAECIIACDGRDAHARAETVRWSEGQPILVTVHSAGYLESVHDMALSACRGQYVLRIDDDERISPAMARWLAARSYRASDHWKFPRVHFWGDDRTVLLTPHLYPDHQTRLSVHEKAGGRNQIHCGSRYGGGTEAPVQIEHHKFLVKSYEERLRIAQAYDSVRPGAGTGGLVVFSLPERAYAGQDVRLGTYGAGDVFFEFSPRTVRFSHESTG